MPSKSPQRDQNTQQLPVLPKVLREEAAPGPTSPGELSQDYQSPPNSGIKHQDLNPLTSAGGILTPASAMIRALVPPKLKGSPLEQYRDKSLVVDGVRWFPLSVIAEITHVTQKTIREWVQKKVPFDGEPLQSLYFQPPINRLFVSEDAASKLANRFEKWPSHELAGTVNIGKAKGKNIDHNGYVSLPEAQKIVGVSKRTMQLWAIDGKSPSPKPLDVIRDKGTGHFYINAKDVHELKKIGPARRGPQGRRQRPRALNP